MNVGWTIFLSFAASIIGGILSGLFVMRKISHDNKRLYAHQVFDDFKFMYIDLFYSVLIDLRSLGYEDDITIPTGPESTDLQETRSLLTGIRQWLSTNGKEALSKHNKDELIHRIDTLMQDTVCSEFGIKGFIAKYPIQTSYFDNLYEAAFLVDSLSNSLNGMGIDNIKPIVEVTIDSYSTLLDIIEELSKGIVVIEYYRKVKSWTWQLFIPAIRS